MQVTLFLVFEKALGARSKWADYIQAMSAQTLSPIYWPEEDRKLLENTQLLQSLEGYECAKLHGQDCDACMHCCNGACSSSSPWMIILHLQSVHNPNETCSQLQRVLPAGV